MVEPVITINAKDLTSVSQALLSTPKELEIAQSRAISATISQGRNEVRRDIPLNMTEKRKNVALFSGAKRKKLQGVLGAKDIDTPLTWFSGWREKRGAFTFRAATKKSSGVTAHKRLAKKGTGGLYVRWYKGGTTVHVPSGFIMRDRTGSAGRAFMRAPASFGRRQGKYYASELKKTERLVHRLAIWPIFGPSVYEEFTERLSPYEKRIADLYVKKLAASLNYIVSSR